MRKHGVWIAAALAIGACATHLPPGSPMARLAGIYTEKVRLLSFSDPERLSAYDAKDEIVIKPIDAMRAKVGVGLNFANGHQCGIDGTATIEGDHLLLRAPTDEGGMCALTISRRLNSNGVDSIVLDVLPNSTCYVFCGMRGTLDGANLPVSSRKG